jgi:hypothetical protein
LGPINSAAAKQKERDRTVERVALDSAHGQSEVEPDEVPPTVENGLTEYV